MRKKLAIFDLDGTLFDTTQVNYYSYRKASQSQGFSFCDFEYFKEHCNGRHYTTFLPNITTNNETLLLEIHREKKQSYKQFIQLAKENVHLFSILKALNHEYYISLVTTASKQNTMDLLEAFQKNHLFDIIITSEDVEQPKPSPEGFLKAMKHFEISSKDTIIFEDSSVGLRAAEMTGAVVFKVESF